MRISVIIPARNEEDYLQDTLKALSNQTLNRADYEIIVCNDASADNTAEIAGVYADKVLNLEKCRTIGEVRNKGALKAKGKHLLFVDADTIVDKDLLEKSLELKQPCGIPKKIEFGSSKLYSFLNKVNNLAVKYAPNLVLTPGCCLFVEKSKFEEVKGFKEDLLINEDNDLFKSLRVKGYNPSLIDSKVNTSNRRVLEKGFLNYFLENLVNFLKHKFN